MSDENSCYQQDTAPAVSDEKFPERTFGPDAESTDAGTESQHARLIAYSKLTGLELMHAPWIQL